MRGLTDGGVPRAVGTAPVSRRAFLRAGLLGLAPLGLLGCIPEPTSVGGPGIDTARLAARPGTPTETPESGASWLNINRTGRDAILYVPEGYDPETPAPLLVTLHGRAGGASSWESFYAKCDLRGLVMLAVESRGVTWDRISSGSFGPDVAYTDAALAYAFDRIVVDPARIALAGFSDGASYALSLGLSNGDLFTHLIAFSPGFSAPGRELFGRPWIWISHGRDDPILSESYTRNEIVKELRDDDYSVQYVPFDGGHEVPADISAAALDWLLA